MAQRANIVSRRHDQVVFPIDEEAVAAGMAADLVGGWFVYELGKDRDRLNDFLAAIRRGEFSDARALKPPPWMAGGRNIIPSSGSLRQRALNTLAAIRWLESAGIPIEKMRQIHVVEIGRSLEKNGLKPGSIGIIQMSACWFRQFLVWRKEAPPLVLSVDAARTTQRYRCSSTNLPAIRKQGPSVPRPLDRQAETGICAIVTEPAKHIAVTLLFRSGLRDGETGRVLDREMPTLMSASATMPNFFSVVGKGSKLRAPEADMDLIRKIDHYRLSVRPDRAARYMRCHKTDTAPEALLLNSHDGSPLSRKAVYLAFKSAAAAIGMPEAVPQWARHAYVANYLAEGLADEMDFARDNKIEMDFDTVMDALRFEVRNAVGHNDPATTDHYSKNVRYALRDAFAQRRRETLEQATL